ncbi:MAG: hypothetical protein HKO63_07285 [Acidimicrobiia bacterium]|nr:hypothetical protein [Acidimicrobiia bacterium]
MSSSLRIALAALAAASVIVVAQMVALDTDASLYLSFGAESAETLAYGESRLGEVYVKPNLGHDGRLFYIAAHDPFILDPDSYQELFERPVYRSQRGLFPVIASPALLFGEWPLVWWMLVMNVLAIGAGTFVTARIAEHLGLSPWLGLAFAANPGIWAELSAGGSGALAWALASAAVLALLRGRLRWSIALLAAAALSREAMLLVAIGLAAGTWRTDRRRALWLAAVPIGAVVAWGIYVRIRLGEPLWTNESRELAAPFVGLVDAAREWIDRSDPMRAAVAGLYLVLGFRVFQLARSTRHLIGWAVIGFVLLIPFLSGVVWFDIWDISRALLPLVTALALLAGLEPARADSRS